MKPIVLKVLSLLALAASIVPSLMFVGGTLNHEAVKWLALIGTLVWFLSTPLWMDRELPLDAKEIEI